MITQILITQINSFSDISFLRTFDAYLGVKHYIDTAKSNGDLIIFNGAGKLLAN